MTGVWSSVSAGMESEFGGEQRMITASVIVPASSTINKSIIGQRATYGSYNLRVSNVDVGTNETTVYFNDETEGLKL